MENGKVVFDGFNKIVEFETSMKGKKVKRELLVTKSAVAGIVIDENNRIGLVSQWRPVIQRHTKEIPAGVLDKAHLSALETLIEELMEECATPKEDILSYSVKSLPEYFMMPGNTDSTICFYEIRVKAQENKEVEDADVDSVEWVTLEEMKRYIDNGTICDGKTILTYYYLLVETLMDFRQKECVDNAIQKA